MKTEPHQLTAITQQTKHWLTKVEQLNDDDSFLSVHNGGVSIIDA